MSFIYLFWTCTPGKGLLQPYAEVLLVSHVTAASSQVPASQLGPESAQMSWPAAHSEGLEHLGPSDFLSSPYVLLCRVLG